MTAATKSQSVRAPAALPRALRAMIGRLDKRAFGLATGVALGAWIAAITAWQCIAPDPAMVDALALLRNFFRGYTVSWAGVAVGFLWGLWTGFLMGWFVAFTRNFAIAVWILYVRIKSRLESDRGFLDHI